MRIDNLQISNLRNIDRMDIAPCARLNGIWGANGAGKTAVLETIYLLGRGKSFRGTDLYPLTKKGSLNTAVFGLIQEKFAKKRIAVEIKQKTKEIQVDGVGKYSAAELAKEVKILIITPDHVQKLLTSPANRRKFIDWGVFHVEPRYHEEYRRFMKVLRQRNSALTTGDKNTDGWDQSLIEISNLVDQRRSVFLEHLNKHISTELKRLEIDYLGVEVRYQKGWSTEKSLQRCLEEYRTIDIKRGFTCVGPHRGGFKLVSDGKEFHRFGSSGQGKLVISALNLALARLIDEKTGELPVLLYDEIESELDTKNTKMLVDAILELKLQVFLTALDGSIKSKIPEVHSKLFHVEQGRLID